MNDRIRILENSGKKILFVSYSNLGVQEMLNLIPEMEEVQLSNKINLVVFDVSNTHFNAKLKEAGKASIKFIESQIGKVYGAVFGIRGIQRIIASAIDRNTYFANDLDDAIQHVLNQMAKAA